MIDGHCRNDNQSLIVDYFNKECFYNKKICTSIKSELGPKQTEINQTN
jgi:hypothetical protein